jgi:hypothetical protein
MVESWRAVSHFAARGGAGHPRTAWLTHLSKTDLCQRKSNEEIQLVLESRTRETGEELERIGGGKATWSLLE